MPKRLMPKFISSIFFKLMVIILITGVGINIAIIIFFNAFRHHVARNYHPHLIRYVDYLLEDIGEPPDQGRARKIVAGTDMMITYDGRDQSWTTTDTPISLPVDRIRIRHREGPVQAGSYHGIYVVKVERHHGRLTFILPHQSDAEKKLKFLSLGLLLCITLLMVGAFLTIRWVLKPLRWLKQGVEQVAQGDLNYRVPLKRADELRDLSASFNTMTERLRHLIKSKEQLLLDVSHELRTPITRIKVALALMPASLNRTSIEEDLQEVARKITELLETARSLNIKASLNPVEVEVMALLQTTARQFVAGSPSIQITAKSPLPEIRVDIELIRKALKNIFDNAQKYSPDDATSVQVSAARQADDIVIIIQDSGVGIPAEDIDFIFEPFYRADKARTPQQDGYGLGLSLAKNIIEAHGGDIVIRSTVGRGTRVQVRLPLPSHC